MSTENYFEAGRMLKRLLEGNVKYVQKHSVEFEPIKAKQTPGAALLACCDSRVPQHIFELDGPNEIFTVRNIGNQYGNSAGSVKYAIFHLHTPLLVVLGHTGCGAIKASLSDYRADDAAIQREVIGLVNSIRLADQTRDMSKVADENLKLAVYSQINVDRQINEVLEDNDVKTKINSKALCIVGMMFDFHNVYGGKLATAYVTNINGVTDIDAMKKLDLAAEVGAGLSDVRFKRL